MKSMLKTICFSTLGLMSSQMIYAQSNYWIVGGQNATEGQFPWLGDIRVSYGTQRYHHCGSTLIHPYWVLTAAHCLLGSDIPTHVRFNTVNMTTPNVNPNGGVEVEVDTFFSHTSFDINLGLGNGYDLGLIKLKQPVTSIATVAMPQHGDTALYYAANRAVLIAGWGLKDTFSMQASDIMKWANTKIIGRAKCNEYYPSASGNQITNRVVCVGYEGNEVQSGSAAGDSGGSLWIEQNGTKYVIGLVSGGSGPTTLHERPGIFTNVAYFRPWIDSVMNNNQPSSIPHAEGFNDENVSIFAAERSVKLKIGNIPAHTIFVQLCNVEGKVIYRQSLNNPKFQTHRIDLSGFAPGMYVIRIYDNAGNHMYRKLQHVSY